MTIRDRGFALGLAGTIMGGISLGAIGVYLVMDRQLDDAKIQAGTAKSDSRAHQATVIANLAADDVKSLRLEFEAYKAKHP